jgi:hypothetical protein
MRRNAVALLAVLSASTYHLSHAQLDTTKLSKNVIYLELGGAGGYSSLNYEMLLGRKKTFSFSARIGLNTYHLKDYTNKLNPDIILPLTAYASCGKHHKLEIGLGQVFTNSVQVGISDYQKKRKTNFHSHLSIGYRYQKNTSGFFFHAAYTPLLENNQRFKNWLGIGFGYTI